MGSPTNISEKQQFLMVFLIDHSGMINHFEVSSSEEDVSPERFTGKNIKDITADDGIMYEIKNMITLHKSSASFEINNTGYHAICSYHENFIHGAATKAFQPQEDKTTSERYFTELFEKSPDAIAIIDNSGNIIKVNNMFTQMFGYSFEEACNTNVNAIIKTKDDRFDFSNIYEKLSISDIQVNESIITVKEDRELYVMAKYYPVKLDENKKYIYAVYSDISGLKKNEEQLVKSLMEKEVLLKEVHHRVKNNLQIISSLLNFQSRFIKDESSVKIFKETKNIVRSIGLIHEKLYQTKEISRLEFSDYIRSLVSHLFLAYNAGRGRINYRIKADNLFLSVDNAIPCGLIINELVTNSLKHAFPDDMQGEIMISLEYKSNRYILKVKDNGIGIPESVDIDTSNSLGLQLVNTLVGQMDADMKIDRTDGTEYTITFSNLNYKTRI